MQAIMKSEFSVVEADNRKEFEDKLNSQIQFGFQPLLETFKVLIDSRYSCTVYAIILKLEN